MHKHRHNIKNRIRDLMNRTPLWAEFILFLAAILIILTVVLSWSIYEREQKRTVRSQMEVADKLLRLKITMLDEYIELLSEYAILPIYDSSIYSIMLSGGEMTNEQIEETRSKVRTYYYSRGDLLSYSLYFLKHNMAIGKSYGRDGIRAYDTEDITQTDMYRMCASNKKNYAILPSDNPGALFHFVHSIIRIQDREIIALTDFEVNSSDLFYLSSKSGIPHEITSLYSIDGNLLYTNAEDDLKEELSGYDGEKNRSLFFVNSGNGKPVYRDISGSRYLLTYMTNADETVIMTSLVPLSDILSEIKQTRFFAINIGLVFLLLATAAAYILIRYLSAPLSDLVKIQEEFGAGDTMDVRLGRSREGAELGRSFNHMTHRIDTLIKENYAAELNEKNARLATLEAQVNPHFLYNTLQAIGSEALMNDQTEIYNMLIGLASNMRYSIKGDNIVPLRDELRYVENYIKLQKIRMGNHLTVEQYIDEAAYNFPVPRISVQTLIENSILHGIGGEKTSVRIILNAYISHSRAVISVEDDGIGINEEDLEKIRSSFRKQTLQDANQGIGLANLYNRIRILYGDEACLEIESKTENISYTLVRLILPNIKSIEADGSSDVQDTDN